MGRLNPDDDNRALLYARSASRRWIGSGWLPPGAGPAGFTEIEIEEANMILVDCSNLQW